MTKINRYSLALVVTTLALTLSSCAAIAGIFKAGLWFGIIAVVVVIAIIFWVINKVRK